MVTPTGSPPRFADAARRRLRDAVLDEAAAAVVAGGWTSLTMRALAERVGVSRQTLYNEFGAKEPLGQELALRQGRQLLDGLQAVLAVGHDSLEDAVAAGVEHVLRTAGDDPLIKAVLVRSGADELLPFLTTRSQPVHDEAVVLLADEVRARCPDVPDARVALVSDALVRLVSSHLVLPLAPVDVTARQLAELAVRVLVPPTGSGTPAAPAPQPSQPLEDM